MKFDVWVFCDNLSRKFTFDRSLISIAGILHENECTRTIVSHWIIIRIRNVPDGVVEKIKTHISCSVTSGQYRVVYEIMWKKIWYSQTGYRWQGKAGSKRNWQNRNKTENSLFWDKSVTFMKHFLNLFVSSVTLSSPVACRLKTKSFLFCCKCHFPADRSQRSADLSHCVEDLDLTNRNEYWRDVRVNIFCLLNVVPTQKTFIVFFLLMRGI
jgi:hypothetical protein